MALPSWFDGWWRRWGGRVFLIALTISALVSAWRMWKHPRLL